VKALFAGINAARNAFVAWPRIAVGLAGAAAIVIILVIDAWLGAGQRSFLEMALTDETAHLLTAIILLAALLRVLPPEAMAGVLTGVVLIDLDHLPILIGSDLLMRQTNRPLTHSLLVAVAVAAVALALPARWRWFALGVAGGIVAHFWRDMASSTAGVPLLWPWQSTGFLLPYEVYLASLVGAVAIAVWQRARSGL
jgi:inner membrane protein